MNEDTGIFKIQKNQSGILCKPSKLVSGGTFPLKSQSRVNEGKSIVGGETENDTK